MSKILIVIDEPLATGDGKMAGLQVRAFEMSRALARRGHDVTIAAANGLAQAGSGPSTVRCIANGAIDWSAYDAWIATPLVAHNFSPAGKRIPFVLDGYEAPFSSFVAHTAALLPAIGERALHDYRGYIQRYLRALQDADLVLCATEEQRICYLSLLCVLGVINPKYPAENMVAVVQSGAPPEIPDVPPREAKSSPSVLWAGGAYPWFDVETLIGAIPEISAALPDIEFVLAGLGGRDQAGDRPQGPELGRRIAEAIGANPELGARCRFVPWQPYAQRGAIYGDADLAVCTGHTGLESLFAMRTRLLDLAWAGVPAVVTKGDALGRKMEAVGAAITIDEGDSRQLAAAVVGVLRDGERRSRMARAARTLAAREWAWDTQIESLHRFCEAPRLAPGRDDVAVHRTMLGMVAIRDGFAWKAHDFAMRGWWWLRRRMGIGSHGAPPP